MTIYFTPASSILNDWKGPSIPPTKVTKDFVRLSGIFIEQQTFLGASIRSFSASAGGGSSPSSLNVELVEDFKNLGPHYQGAKPHPTGMYDLYHLPDGVDKFNPPPVGYPVFFSFCEPKKPIAKAYKDQYTLSNKDGRNFLFGGILKSFAGTNSTGGKTYSAIIEDPREILSNVVMILNSYTGSVVDQDNLLNVYGFLEFNPGKDFYQTKNTFIKNFFRRNSTGGFGGDDMFYTDASVIPLYHATNYFKEGRVHTQAFPITGFGMSRRGQYGMPYYRILQALAFISALPEETSSPLNIYRQQNFFGRIQFRGFYYSINLANLPKLNPLYMFDSDSMTIMDFLIEIAEATGHEISVTLDPPLDFDITFNTVTSNNYRKAGTINVIFVDKNNNRKTSISSILNTINTFASTDPKKERNQIIEKEDVGQEMSNNISSKFLIGGNSVDMYTFTSNHDRGRYLALINNTNPKSFPHYFTLDDQVIPYYGKLSNNVVTIPKYYGPWKQIMLDAAGLSAVGVGAYYVATEMELMCAAHSFNMWKTFLEFYNGRVFMEYYRGLKGPPGRKGFLDVLVRDESVEEINGTVDNQPVILKVPRCLFNTEKLISDGSGGYTFDNYCSPGFGYPLYYGRAEAIGLTFSKSIDGIYEILSDLNLFQDDIINIRNVMIQKYQYMWNISPAHRIALNAILSGNKHQIASAISSIEKFKINTDPATNKKRLENAEKVYNFLKKIADECLGKKFLVRLPSKSNAGFPDNSTNIILDGFRQVYQEAPFGFKPIGKKEDIDAIKAKYRTGGSFVFNSNNLTYSTSEQKIKNGFNVGNNILENNKITYNYSPSTEGGYIPDFLINLATQKGLLPADYSFLVDNGRYKSYVRFNHSEDLDFSIDNGVIKHDPVSGELYGDRYKQNNPNGTEIAAYNIPRAIDEFDYFNNVADSGTVCTFVKCDIDPEVYFAPNVCVRPNCSVFDGVFYRDINKPLNIKTNSSGVKTALFPYPSTYRHYYISKYTNQTSAIPDFIRYPANIFGKKDTGDRYLIETTPSNIAYALITLPGRATLKQDKILSNMTQYFRNNYLVPTYELPSTLSNIATLKYTRKEKIINFSIEPSTFANRFHELPPVMFPDLVCLALESRDTCYGPWKTNLIKFEDKWIENKGIGGRIDFEKDDSLTPWNYGSYELMNAAGIAKTESLNSILLASEYGSITFAGLPSGTYQLGNIIGNYGPLLSNISVDVSDNGVRTTFKFQSYTPNYQMLKKQSDKAMNLIMNQQKKIKELALFKREQSIAKNLSLANNIYPSKPQNINNTTQTPTLTWKKDQSIIDPNDNSQTPDVISTPTNGETSSENLPQLLTSATPDYSTHVSASYMPYHDNMPFIPNTNNQASEFLREGNFDNDSNITSTWSSMS